MTTTDKEWIYQKRQEIWRVFQQFGDMAAEWDGPRYMAIIDSLESQIRRLKTQLGAKR